MLFLLFPWSHRGSREVALKENWLFRTITLGMISRDREMDTVP